jgi:hypothetical protein
MSSAIAAAQHLIIKFLWILKRLVLSKRKTASLRPAALKFNEGFDIKPHRHPNQSIAAT